MRSWLRSFLGRPELPAADGADTAVVADGKDSAPPAAESEAPPAPAPRPATRDFQVPRRDSDRLPFTRLAAWLPYTVWDDEHELFLIEATEPDTVESVGFCLELRPQLGASEEMADYLTTLFTPHAPAGTGIVFQLFGTPDLTAFYGMYERITKGVDDAQGDPERSARLELLRAMAKRRVSYYRTGATQGVHREMNFRMRDFRANCNVTVPVPRVRNQYPTLKAFRASPDYEKTMQTAALMREAFISTLKAYHLYLKTWKPDDLINWCAQILNMQRSLSGDSFALTYDAGRDIREQIIAQETGIHESELSIELEDATHGSVFVRGMGVRSYPKAFCLNQMSELLGSPTNNTLSYPCPFLITLGVATLDYDTEKNRTTVRSVRATTGAESQMAKFQPDMQDRKRDWDIALASYNEGKGSIRLFHQLLLFARREDLEKAEQAARAIWRSQNFDITVDRKMQKQALLSSMPMMFGPLMQSDLRTTQRCSTKTVFNAANMMPTLGEHTGIGLPVVTLFGRRGQAMSVDLFANPSGNNNACVVGTSGSGKSFFLNELTQRTLATGGRVRIIDVGRSYQNMCGLLGGQFLEFTPSSQVCLNPFSMVVNLDEDMQMLKPLLGQMISPSRALDDYEMAQIDINVRQLWAEHGRNTTITMLAERLKLACFQGGSKEAFEAEAVSEDECDPRIRDLGVQLFPFTADGTYGRFFEGEANINLDSDLVVLELEELKSMKDLQTVVMQLVMYRIVQEMYTGDRSRRTLVIIDEAWDVMQGKQSGAFIEAGYRRARKYGGSFCTGTQSVADYYASPTAQAAWENADWTFLLRQKAESLDQLQKAGRLSLSEYDMNMVRSLKTQKGLFSEVFVRCGDLPGTVGRLFGEPFTQLLMSSDADDFRAVRAYTSRGMGIEQAVTQVLADRQKGQHGHGH